LCLPITPPPTEVADEFVPRTYADRQTPSSSGLRSADLHLDIHRELRRSKIINLQNIDSM